MNTKALISGGSKSKAAEKKQAGENDVFVCLRSGLALCVISPSNANEAGSSTVGIKIQHALNGIIRALL